MMTIIEAYVEATPLTGMSPRQIYKTLAHIKNNQRMIKEHLSYLMSRIQDVHDQVCLRHTIEHCAWVIEQLEELEGEYE